MRRVLGAIGRVLTTLGLLILLFVAYQLWGTSIYTDRLQNELAQDFAAALERAPDRSSTTTTTNPTPTPSTTTTTTTPPLPPPVGEAVAQIRIPKIGLDNIVVNGTSREDLRKGPGHYPDTPMPGQEGNAAIAGHRTTYGAPFGNLDQLAPGDRITVRTLEGTFDFDVTEQLIVDPSDVAVLKPVHEEPFDASSPLLATLTLTTCNPKYSAAQRLVVKAQLSPEFEPLPAPVELPKQPHFQVEDLSGDEGSKLPTVLAGLVVALVGALWLLFYHRHPRWTTWLMGVVPFAIVLFVFYVFLERVLPSNY
ncbi:MAG: class E sortase [Acidimicrobiia bacterium]